MKQFFVCYPREVCSASESCILERKNYLPFPPVLCPFDKNWKSEWTEILGAMATKIRENR